MNTVLSLIIMLCQCNLKKDVNYTISTYIINHLNMVENMSIKQLAENSYTSTTSIIKYCQLLGFHSYADFKRILYSTCKTRKLQLKDKLNKVTEEKLFRDIQFLSIENINYDIFIRNIDDIVELIYKYQIIHFYGATFPLGLTASFCEDMVIMGIPSYIHQIHYGEHDIKKQKGLQIIVTISGRYIQTHRNDYYQLYTLNDVAVLISQEKENIGDIALNLPLPKSENSENDEIIFLMILNLIKLRYYNKYVRFKK